MLIRRRLEGLSLIEMLVAITLFSLLIAAGGPSMVSWTRSSNIRNAADAAQNGLRRARIEAIKQNRNVTFWLVTSSRTNAPPDDSCALTNSQPSWVISIDNPAGRCSAPPSMDDAPRIIESAGVVLSEDVEFAATDFDGNPARFVTFNSQGRPTNTDQIAQIDVSHSDAGVRKLRVEVSSGGSIRLCHRASDITIDDPTACIR